MSDIIPLLSLRIDQRARVRHIRRRLRAAGPRAGAAIKCVGGRQRVSLCASLLRCCLLGIAPVFLARSAEVVLQVTPGPVGRALRREAGQDDPHLQTRVSDVSVTPPLELTQPGVWDVGRSLSGLCSHCFLFLGPRSAPAAPRTTMVSGWWERRAGCGGAGPGGATVMMTSGDSECPADAITAAL